MKKRITYLIVMLAILTLVTGCSYPFTNQVFKKSSGESEKKGDAVTIEGNYEVEYDKNIIPENEKLLLSKGFYGFTLLTRKGIENITDIPFVVNKSIPRNAFYDNDQICGFYVSKNDEGIIYLYNIKTKEYKEILKEFQYTPQKQFFNISYFKNNKIIATGEYNDGFTVFNLNTRTVEHITVKMNRKEFYVDNVVMCEQGYLVCCGYREGNRFPVEHIFIDKNGTIIKSYKIPNIQNLGSRYMELSPDSSMLLYSIGKTGDNRYLYDFTTETVYELYDSHSPGTQWSSDGKSFYLFDYIGKQDNRVKWKVTKRDVKDIIINK